uniref:NADH-ubiquinone oxidoreductase chain 6 n=1 Tax=Cerithidea djadjariensis TaxID=334428 RepID=D6RTK8_9CAEN|nr:NADH dehydrogenase subunit 6 [Cerithidea djadjariensis]BAJ09660.1 NADH dehydrogenase subunit 6 [Cerithidea djadjariensis]BDA99912.1 NADH dehydrogenase subunit 6 [Pirenella pupiformis]
MGVSIILSLGLCSVFLFPLMAQPLSLGLSIMFSTMLLCLAVGMFLSSWYGYILFLIYVGGLLVMFAYVAALSPNVLFGGGGPFIFLAFTQFFVPVVLFNSTFLDMSSLSPFLSSREMLSSMKILGIELVSPSLVSVLVGLGVVLLINLIVVVKICYYQRSTLRPFKTT